MTRLDSADSNSILATTPKGAATMLVTQICEHLGAKNQVGRVEQALQ